MTQRTPGEILNIYERLYYAFQVRARERSAKAHPETGGSPQLINNWGNPEARRIREHYEDVTTKLLKRRSREFNRAEHDQRHSKKFAPLWCKFCQN